VSENERASSPFSTLVDVRATLPNVEG